MYNRNGLRYFLNISTLNRDQEYLILPLDIRRYIWKLAHDYSFIQCNVCDCILVYLEINLDYPYITENYSIINGLTSCSDCLRD